MRKITKAEKEKTVHDILQMLNGLPYWEAVAILKKAGNDIRDILIVAMPEDKFPAQVSDVREQIISGITKIVSASIDDMAKSGLAHNFSENAEK